MSVCLCACVCVCAGVSLCACVCVCAGVCVCVLRALLTVARLIYLFDTLGGGTEVQQSQREENCKCRR